MLISENKFLQPMPRSPKIKTCMNLNLGAQAPWFYLGASVPYTGHFYLEKLRETAYFRLAAKQQEYAKLFASRKMIDPANPGLPKPLLYIHTAPVKSLHTYSQGSSKLPIQGSCRRWCKVGLVSLGSPATEGGSRSCPIPPAPRVGARYQASRSCRPFLQHIRI